MIQVDSDQLFLCCFNWFIQMNRTNRADSFSLFYISSICVPWCTSSSYSHPYISDPDTSFTHFCCESWFLWVCSLRVCLSPIDCDVSFFWLIWFIRDVQLDWQHTCSYEWIVLKWAFVMRRTSVFDSSNTQADFKQQIFVFLFCVFISGGKYWIL